MANPTVQNGSGVTFTFQAGDVETVRAKITAGVDQTTFPGAGPSAAFLFDFEGVNKIVTLSGTLTEASSTRTSSGTTTTILAQKQWLEANLSGLQSSVTFTSTYDSQSYDGSSFQTTKVMFGDVEFTENQGDPEHLSFTITLLVGT